MQPLPLSQILADSRPLLLERWRARVVEDPDIEASFRLGRIQLNDHIPFLLGAFAARLRGEDDAAHEKVERELSESHSRHRWQQGYDLRGMVREWGHLNSVLVGWLEEQGAPVEARLKWADFVRDNESQAIALYEELLRSEARSKLRDVEEALEGLRALERARGHVLREASHDLRGGLSVVQSASSLLGHEAFPEDERERVEELLLSGVRGLGQMMNDLLDMARLEAGVETPDIHAFDAGALLLGACQGWKGLAQNKSLEFEFAGPETLVVEGDATKVRRIAQNLILNAIKYTERGSVRVRWSEDADNWTLEVADTGRGLESSNAAPLAQTLESASPDAPPPTFSPTDEENDPSSRPGEGIGLSIVRRLCELLGATLELQSGPDGSTFRVVFSRENGNS